MAEVCRDDQQWKGAASPVDGWPWCGRCVSQGQPSEVSMPINLSGNLSWVYWIVVLPVGQLVQVLRKYSPCHKPLLLAPLGTPLLGPSTHLFPASWSGLWWSAPCPAQALSEVASPPSPAASCVFQCVAFQSEKSVVSYTRGKIAVHNSLTISPQFMQYQSPPLTILTDHGECQCSWEEGEKHNKLFDFSILTMPMFPWDFFFFQMLGKKSNF